MKDHLGAEGILTLIHIELTIQLKNIVNSVKKNIGSGSKLAENSKKKVLMAEKEDDVRNTLPRGSIK